MDFNRFNVDINIHNDVAKIYKEEVFSEEYAKNFIPGKFISYKPISIAGRAGFLVVSEATQEKANQGYSGIKKAL